MYVPSDETLRRLAAEAGCEHNLVASDTDWDCRHWLTPPGLVWSVPSDTCMSGRLAAPHNVAYGEFGEEFVYRQPRNERELEALFTAARAEAYDCYRFDGLRRWTEPAVDAWQEMSTIAAGWVEHVLRSELTPEITSGLADCRAYRESNQLGLDLAELREYLRAG